MVDGVSSDKVQLGETLNLDTLGFIETHAKTVNQYDQWHDGHYINSSIFTETDI